MRRVVQIEAPWCDPAQALAALAGEAWSLCLLSGGGGLRGRWSYLAARPQRVLVVEADDAADPLAALADLIPEGEMLAEGPPFQGGVVGLATYELGGRAQGLGLAPHRDWPHLAAGLYPAVLAFDHRDQRLLAIGRGEGEDQARGRAQDLLAALGAPNRTAPGRLAGPMTASSGQAYEAAVAEVVGRIAAGEIFQANVARRWTGDLAAGATPYDLFARLAQRSAAPFAAYLRLPGRAVVSNSPERFVALRRGADGLTAETRPIKGTRPRGVDATQDAALAAELLASAKDRAENLMIVDLMRNDLARVCRPGTVKVPDLFAIESFANVHHLVSTVTGRMQAGRGGADLLQAAFPPGSITGAPKIQAMKVIEGLEPPRGPYCGSIFWAGVDGAFDSSVLIRTAACVETPEGWRVEARAGAGLVADSDPVAERLETEAKISAILAALSSDP
ncbi:anthranilate synthase component I family protein [Phenylobacterium sp.]|uniref:anthranilate synthase component I family protein n=1 Tax=Phenylobacterium sp. TaxID=1871053 RepID=UPI00272FDE95|nr:anthranilate synthase component I family protein [Phenylobacterium sp.]MDP1617141.1 anthranilate synthase component I family protein [Phenylobacterium sp.]MDP1989031.1 anthranilate synthase component I family protein [Phenylobacterium sp.]